MKLDNGESMIILVSLIWYVVVAYFSTCTNFWFRIVHTKFATN